MTNKLYIKNVRTFFEANKITVLSIIFFAIISDIIFFTQSSDIIFFGMLGLYLITVFIYKLKSKLTFLFCLVLLSVMYLQFIFTGTSLTTEKTAVWLFLFTAMGILQQLREGAK